MDVLEMVSKGRREDFAEYEIKINHGNDFTSYFGNVRAGCPDDAAAMACVIYLKKRLDDFPFDADLRRVKMTWLDEGHYELDLTDAKEQREKIEMSISDGLYGDGEIDL